MNVAHLVETFELEARLLDGTLRQHPRLRALFGRDFSSVDVPTLKDAYVRLLKLKTDYVAYTVPALRAAGEALRGGDDCDRAWSALFLGYAQGETDEAETGSYGHEVWARNDMRALGAPAALVDAPPELSATLYGAYFVDDACHHPYAILGAKGVLEHFSLRVSDDVVRGVLASGMANAEHAVSFFKHHGVLDIDHVREGDRNLERVRDPDRFQVLQGAYMTSGFYRSMLRYLFPT
jgi:Iron-containing redox enzyme